MARAEGGRLAYADLLRVAAILAQHGAAPEKLILINLGKAFLPEGTVPQLQHKAGIDAEGIARAVWEAST